MARPKLEEPADFPFLLARSDTTPPGRFVRNAVGSLAVHAVILLVAMVLPEVSPPVRAPLIIADLRKSITLVAPRFTDLTQKDPNAGKVTRSLDVRSAISTPVPQAPRVVPTSPLPGPPAPAVPPAPVPLPVPALEPPKIEIAAGGAPQASGAAVTQLPPPVEKPKLAFESVTSASVRSPSNTPAVSPPKNTIQELAKAAARPGGGGGVTVGDELEIPEIGGLGQAPMPGRMGSNLQLMSDPAGVDFKPYLVQVLTAVRHNWMAVVPESARLGRRGVVLIQFIIDRQGKVAKLVIASPSGTAAFDRAAVVGVSMSHPFPYLPATYKGDEIRLQLAFSYNMSR